MNRYLYLIDVLPFRQLRFPIYELRYREALAELVRESKVMFHTPANEFVSWQDAYEEQAMLRQTSRDTGKYIVTFNFKGSL